MAAQKSVGLLRHLIHERIFFPGRIADELLHALIITLLHILSDPTDVFSPLRAQQAAQITPRVFAHVFAMHHKMAPIVFAMLHEAVRNAPQAVSLIFYLAEPFAERKTAAGRFRFSEILSETAPADKNFF